MRSRKMTMKDVAQRAGVSAMTVSAVLGPKSATVRVSEATRARVKQAARDLHYSPNAIARSLRRRRTNVVGFYTGASYLNTQIHFYAELIGGIEEGCDTHRKDLLLHGTFPDRSVEDVLSELRDGRIDGLVMRVPPDDPLVERLAASDLPVIAVVDAVPALPSVIVDDVEGSRLIVDHLAHKGHRRVLYRGINGADAPFASVDRRINSFSKCAAELQLDWKLWLAPHQVDPANDPLARWKDMPPAERPTAVVCWNDMAAYEELGHCHIFGIRVPEDIAIIGFDGLATPLSSWWRLTTIRAPWAEVARTAVELLVARINGQEPPHETVLPVQLVAGNTT